MRAHLIAVITLLVVLAGFARADDPCDPNLVRPESDVQGYRLRGDRCEGLFAQPRAGSRLRVLSFTAGHAGFEPDVNASVELRWTPLGNEPTFLQVNSLRYGLYYRMDAIRPPGVGVYRWPLDMISALRVRRADLALLAWTRRRFGDRDERVFLPVRIGESTAESYRLAIVPGVPLSSLAVTVRPVGDDGVPGTSVMNRDLGAGLYAVEHPVPVELSLPSDASAGPEARRTGAVDADRNNSASASEKPW